MTAHLDKAGRNKCKRCGQTMKGHVCFAPEATIVKPQKGVFRR